MKARKLTWAFELVFALVSQMPTASVFGLMFALVFELGLGLLLRFVSRFEYWSGLTTELASGMAFVSRFGLVSDWMFEWVSELQTMFASQMMFALAFALTLASRTVLVFESATQFVSASRSVLAFVFRFVLLSALETVTQSE